MSFRAQAVLSAKVRPNGKRTVAAHLGLSGKRLKDLDVTVGAASIRQARIAPVRWGGTVRGMELLAVLAVGFCALLAFGPDPLLKMLLVGVWLLLAVVAAWEPVKWLLLQGGRLVGLAP